MKKILSMILLAALFATACNKDNNPSCAISTTFLSGSYKITAATYKANASSSEANYLDILLPDACERDDIYTFQTNGTYQIKDAGTVCSPPGDDNGN
ncbi:MAG: hypothetical protein E6H08_22515 [Bacteroidetes bacterium]|nr:MAG: hypothetical protein E6H08_22515 [Bacteroidota bacterium]